MQAQLIIAGIIALPLVLGLVFRVSTAHIFFSLMAGELLGRYFGHDVDAQAQPVLAERWGYGYGEIALIILPMVLTALFLRNTTSKGKIILHSVPLAITGIIAAAFILPLLPQSVQEMVATVWIGEQLLELNKVIIGVMIALQLIWLWTVAGREKKEDKKHH
jgi:hypothetical protein